jgi:hypothetical protein
MNYLLILLLSLAAVLALAAAVHKSHSPKPDGTCGYQCTEDSQCSGCGVAGKCSCPDGKASFYQTSCSCVSAPAQPPSDPKPDIEASVWPSQWTADVAVWDYKDWTDKAMSASGKFYFDATLGKTRLDWKVGKSGKQVWIGSGPNHATSDYYASMGPICFKFPITDPGQKGKPQVGIEQVDWMKRCSDAGFAHYVGREQIHVEDKDIWVDHYSCRLDYVNDMTNQSITFQNWHSLGLGSVPKGLPLRVTGGNSKPDPNQSPRMNTVWYSNFATGANATEEADFEEPKNPLGLPCVPLMAEDVHSFFGHPATKEHIMSPEFHRRAAFLLHRKPSSIDLKRARQPKPGHAFLGDSFAKAMQTLNKVLIKEKGLKTQLCSSFEPEMLHKMQRMLFDARTPELDSVYQQAGDTRKMAHADAKSLEAEQARHKDLELSDPELAAKVRDGACHEMVMWYTHHLSASAREAVKENLVLPLLPVQQHEAPAESASLAHKESHQRYTAQASCAVCHVGASGSASSFVV